MTSDATRADLAYRHILDRVLRNELRPGDWIDRRQIAEELHASLMPVSEAVQRLEAEGFLISAPRRGTQVRVPSREDVRGQLLVREALECQAARLYCGELRGAVGRLVKPAERADAAYADPADAWRADLAFHKALVDLADCPALSQTFDRVMNLSLFQHTALITPYSLNRRESHVQLLSELAGLEPDAAEARIRRHIRTGKDHLFADRK